ncbi:NUDIX hydrolase, partial [Burkholderia pseudomallei]
PAAETDLSRCTSTTKFPRRRYGTMIPEMDAVRWTAPADVDAYASRSLARLFGTTLSLAAVHRTLAG